MATRAWSSLTHCPVLQNGDGGTNAPFPGKEAASFLWDPRFLATRTPGPLALDAIARQTANVRRASHRWKVRFDVSTNAVLQLSALASSTKSSTKNSVSCTAWHQANRHSVTARSPDTLPSVSDTKHTTM